MPKHTCRSQCDCCHTWDNCVEATTRKGDLLLCDACAQDLGPFGLPCYTHG